MAALSNGPCERWAIGFELGGGLQTKRATRAPTEVSWRGVNAEL